MRAATQPPLNRVSQVPAGRNLHSASGPVAVTWPNSDLLQQARPLQRCRTPLPSRPTRSNETTSDLGFCVAGVGFEPT
jgi:hypothetical protein